MELESALVQRMEREDKAATDLKTMLAAYQADRTPERRMAYLAALHDFTEMVKSSHVHCTHPTAFGLNRQQPPPQMRSTRGDGPGLRPLTRVCATPASRAD